MRPSVRHPRIHTKSRHAADRSLQSLWFVDAREPQPVPSPSGQRHSATVVNCTLVQQYIRSSDLEPDSKRLPCHVPRSTGCSSRMRDEYMYEMMNCDELLARAHRSHTERSWSSWRVPQLPVAFVIESPPSSVVLAGPSGSPRPAIHALRPRALTRRHCARSPWPGPYPRSPGTRAGFGSLRRPVWGRS